MSTYREITMMTRLDAIGLLVAQDCERWGESERAAAHRLHARRSHGRALNELAARAELADEPGWRELRATADAVLTPADWRELRAGG